MKKNGRATTKLTNPYLNKTEMIESLFGSVPATMTLEEAKEERLKEYLESLD